MPLVGARDGIRLGRTGSPPASLACWAALPMGSMCNAASAVRAISQCLAVKLSLFWTPRMCRARQAAPPPHLRALQAVAASGSVNLLNLPRTSNLSKTWALQALRYYWEPSCSLAMLGCFADQQNVECRFCSGVDFADARRGSWRSFVVDLDVSLLPTLLWGRHGSFGKKQNSIDTQVASGHLSIA